MITNQKLKIKIYADGADLQSIINLNNNDLISGFTTNPSLMKQAGIKDYAKFAKEVLLVVKDKPVSFEVFSDDLKEMEEQAKEIASWGRNLYVKIPITNSKGEKTNSIISNLSNSGVSCNITAVFTLSQVKEVTKTLNNNVDSIISIFAGRIADTGVNPEGIIKESINITKSNPKIKILWASTREVFNIVQAENLKCDIITVPNNLLSKIKDFGKNLEEFSLETVKSFLKDSQAAGFKISIK